MDFIVINHVRTVRTEHDRWGRPIHEPTCTTWVSYYDWLTLPLGWTGQRVPFGWVNRGWSTIGNVRTLTHGSAGWLVETMDGLNVIAGELYTVDSTYDWELRNRVIYLPIKGTQ